jgi:hypothetical protein
MRVTSGIRGVSGLLQGSEKGVDCPSDRELRVLVVEAAVVADRDP